MTFSVRCRGADGALREEVVEAASRAECFAQMNARGIVPVSVREGARKGRNESRPSRSSGGKPKSSIFNLRSSIFLATAVLAAAGGAWWWLAARGDAAHRPEPKADVAVRAAKVAEGPKAPPRAVPGARTAAKGAPARVPPAPAPEPPVAEPAPEAETNAVGSAACPPAPERVFKTDAEALLAMATPAEPGMAVPPLPPFSEETTSNSAEIALASVAMATSNDTERTIGAKIAVEEQKEELRSLMRDGWTFAEYLAALHKKHSDDAEYLREAQRLDAKLRGDATLSDAEYAAYRAKIDEELRERGIPGLTEAERKAEEEDRREDGR